MSLIGDALRKARQEAAERDSDRRGILFSAKIADSPTRSHLGLGLALGAIIAIAATVAGGGAVWWLMGRSEPPVTPTSQTETTVPVPTADPVPLADDVTGGTGGRDNHRDSGSGSEERQDQQSAPASGAAAAAAPAAVVDPSPDPVPDDAPNDVSAGHPNRDPRPGDSGSEYESGYIGTEDGAEIYILEADLGEVRLSLDFLVFRGEDPFAEINGVEVHVGGTIEGYRVKTIERDRVRLSDGRRTIVLRAP